MQVGLFLGCVRCHSSAELFFLLNLLIVEQQVRTLRARRPGGSLCRLLSPSLGQRLTHSKSPLSSRDLTCQNQKPADEFLAFDEGAASATVGRFLAGEVDAGAFGGGVKTVVPLYQDFPASKKSSSLNLFMSAMSWADRGCAFVSGVFPRLLTMVDHEIAFCLSFRVSEFGLEAFKSSERLIDALPIKFEQQHEKVQNRSTENRENSGSSW